MQKVGMSSIPVRRRLNALKKLQLQTDNLKREFRAEVLELEKKYLMLNSDIFEQRAQIVTGGLEPTDEMCVLPQRALSYFKGQTNADLSTVTGVPNFWLNALRNNAEIEPTITPKDHGALESLSDIKLIYLSGTEGFRLDFFFEKNKYFKNEVLSKTYHLIDVADDADDDGPILDYADGTEIEWLPGMDLTVTKQQKRQRHRTKDIMRNVERIVPADSFFNFFRSISREDINECPPPDKEYSIEDDFFIGELIKEKIIPNALRWYTTESQESEEEDDSDYEYYEEDEEEFE